MNNNNVFETVTLPNGGVVQLDKLAFETLDGQCISSHKLNGSYKQLHYFYVCNLQKLQVSYSHSYSLLQYLTFWLQFVIIYWSR